MKHIVNFLHAEVTMAMLDPLRLALASVLLWQIGTSTPKAQEVTMIAVPSSIKAEHKELHDEMAKAIKSGGRTSEAARAVEAVLAPHFEKEEAYAMPPLGLLAPLSRGEATPDMRSVLELTDKLEADMPSMLNEHQQIHAALERLSETAKAENKPEIAQFAERLAHHAKNEEEILYPAALLVGRYVRLKIGQ